jgi:ribosomal protein L40E
VESKECPECFAEIDHRATVCRHCGERIEGIQCLSCLARSPKGASVCRWCGGKLKTAKERRKFAAFAVRASVVGTALTQYSLFPQSASFSQEKIVITTYGFLGLTKSDEEIPWEKVAGFGHHSGYFWDSVWIETRGQSSATIGCLSRADGAHIRQVLRGLEQ